MLLVRAAGHAEDSKGLGVHQPMLERYGEQLVRDPVRHLIDVLPDATVVLIDLGAVRPIGALVPLNMSWLRINPERKEVVEGWLERWNRCGRADEIPVKGLEMPEVEDDPVALGNGPLVKGLGTNECEQGIGARARLSQRPHERSCRG